MFTPLTKFLLLSKLFFFSVSSFVCEVEYLSVRRVMCVFTILRLCLSLQPWPFLLFFFRIKVVNVSLNASLIHRVMFVFTIFWLYLSLLPWPSLFFLFLFSFRIKVMNVNLNASLIRRVMFVFYYFLSTCNTPCSIFHSLTSFSSHSWMRA